MRERDDFLGWVASRLNEAEVALHNGDVGPRFAIWSSNDPVTVFGAWQSGSGHGEVSDIFRQLENAFSDCVSYSHDLIAAEVSGDMAYTVGYEHTQASVNGEPRKYSLRVTQVYRREDGEWKVRTVMQTLCGSPRIPRSDKELRGLTGKCGLHPCDRRRRLAGDLGALTAPVVMTLSKGMGL